MANQLTTEQLRALERLHNHATLYEVSLTLADGRKFLLCYSAAVSRRRILSALCDRVAHVAVLMDVENVELLSGRSMPMQLNAGAVVALTGRTKRDVIMEGNELPYVAA